MAKRKKAAEGRCLLPPEMINLIFDAIPLRASYLTPKEQILFFYIFIIMIEYLRKMYCHNI